MNFISFNLSNVLELNFKVYIYVYEKKEKSDLSCVHVSPINRDVRTDRTSEDQLRENVDLTSRATKYSILINYNIFSLVREKIFY